ncbi:MAG: hypothetical protein GXY52_08090 [Chloroflexi bacterium]|nr:hypothetical protein [Chloroflexota bacterium]
MPYETGEVQGTALAAGELTSPEDIRFKLGLRGWHKIFVAVLNLRSENYMYLKLTGDEGFTGLRSPFREHRHRWCPTEFAEEFYWKSADLTGEDIILSKPARIELVRNACCLLWIRCVPMTEEETAEYLAYHDTSATACIHGHVDGDRNTFDQSVDSEKLLVKEMPLCGTDISELSMEISGDIDNEAFLTSTDDEDAALLTVSAECNLRGNRLFYENREKAYALRIDFLHRHGIRVYAANRMSVASFQTPFTSPAFQLAFANHHPEYYAVMRDGSTVKVCSYAFEQVQTYVIDTLKEYVQYGFDGFTLLWHRGLHIAFEEPVIRRFEERHPGVDPFVLPVKDDRLNGIWCEFMTEFMRKLRAALDEAAGKRMQINVVSEYTPETARHFGLDVETWAREGLIDEILQSNMETFEDLEGCLREDGTIDLARYKEKLGRDYIIKRNHDTDVDRVLDGIPQYLPICKKYGVKFYAAFPWEHTVSPHEYPGIARRMKQAGAEGFFSWDTNGVVLDLPEFHAMSMTGHEKVNEETYTVNYYRMLSLDGSNISAFNPNWRG